MNFSHSNALQPPRASFGATYSRSTSTATSRQGHSMRRNSVVSRGGTAVSSATQLRPLSTPIRRTSAAHSSGGTAVQERLVSSCVLREEMMGEIPAQDQVQYIEVPVIEEVIRTVPRREYIEVEKRVPRYEYEFVERIVEIPQVHYVDRHVDVPQIQEVIRHVPVKQYVEVPREVIRHVPKIEIRYVDQYVEVPGEVIDVPKPYAVEHRVVMPRYIDQEVPCIVAQSLHPAVTESDVDFVDVELREYNPYLVPVDVIVPRPVSRELIAAERKEIHQIVDVPVAHYNALLVNINTHLAEEQIREKLIVANGQIPIATSVTFAPVPTLCAEVM